MKKEMKNNFMKYSKEEQIFSSLISIRAIQCLALVIMLSLFPYISASASGNTQLLRNGVLESSALNKALLSVQNGTKTNKENNDKITEKSKELEGVFISVMIEPMFPNGKESDLYGGGNGQGIFRSLMIQEYGKIMANAGGVGLTKGIEKQLLQQQ